MIKYFAIALSSLALAACAEPSGDGGAETPPVAATPVELNGAWRLVELKGSPVSEFVSLEFNENRSIGGNAPCNRYFGNYTATSDFSFTASDIGSTRRACPQLSQEVVYFDALDKAAQYRIGREGDGLSLLDSAGATLASYVRTGDKALDLAGNWRVTEVLVDGALANGPELGGVAFNFSESGFSGNLGCNSIAGDYEFNGEALTIGTTAVTARQCFAPAPFEAPIIALLPQVTKTVATSGGFEMQNAAGAALLRLAR